MEQKKVTTTERKILIQLSKVNTYINSGTWYSKKCAVIENGKSLISFNQSTLKKLKEKGFIDQFDMITVLGGFVAVHGHLPTAEAMEKLAAREKALTELGTVTRKCV